MLQLQNEIPSPADMHSLEAKHRQHWRIMDVLARTLHEMFLTMGMIDVVQIQGKPTDAWAFHAVGQILGNAGWCVLVTQNMDNLRLFVGYNQASVHGVAGMAYEAPKEEENNGRDRSTETGNEAPQEGDGLRGWDPISDRGRTVPDQYDDTVPADDRDGEGDNPVEQPAQAQDEAAPEGKAE